MKSNRIASLVRLNNQLQKSAWQNYVRFLETLLGSSSSIDASPLAFPLLNKVGDGDWAGLVGLADSYSSTLYPTASEHRLANQFAAVIRKYPFPSTVVNLRPREKALKTFLSAEHRCKRINQRFIAYRKVRSPHESYLHDMINWIQYTIGDQPNLRAIGSSCRFGPGASIGVTGNSTSMGRKMLAPEWTVTAGAYNLVRSVLKDDSHYFELLTKRPDSEFFSVDPTLFDLEYGRRTKLVDYNKITFVPKTASTERTIAVEPLLNGYLQLGIESQLRHCLKRVGIDIRDQTRNARLAREGSLASSDPYVTIDLSSASDSIATELCRYVLPPDWFYLLDQARSRNYMLNGKKFPFNKFVTMGNGFCFPLETLIFGSACHAVYKKHNQKPDFSVYGDDIICRQSVATDLISLLGILGFKTNLKKTHITGPFRESCGTDWYNGDDVRPITLDEAFDSVENIIKFVNLSRSKDVWRDIFYEANQFLVGLIPPEHRYMRPYKGTVYGALEVPLDEFMTSGYARFCKETQSWSWLEIVKQPCYDNTLRAVDGYEVALMRGAVMGLTARSGDNSWGNSPSPFTDRRKTSTKVRRMAYCGTTNNWVPPTDMLSGVVHWRSYLD